MPILVLGAHTRHGYPSRILVDRLRRALPLIDAHPVVVSGNGEAAAMSRWLIDHGVPESQILREPGARSTNENLENARALLPDAPHWTVVTSNFHVPRTRLWAWHLDFPCVVVPAPALRHDLIAGLARECLALPHSFLRIMWRRLRSCAQS